MTETPAESVYIGVDVGGTTIIIVALDRNGEIRARRKLDTFAAEGHEAVLRRVCSAVHEIKGALAGNAIIAAAGVALPGIMNMEQGISLFLPNMPGTWPNVPVASILLDELGTPTFLLNDARAAALGESEYGAGRKVRNLVMLTLGTGIGGGVIIDNELYFGAKGWAGEIGHITVDSQGPRCSCGNYGCVEALSSGPAIASAAIRIIKQGFTTPMRDMVNGDLNLVTPEIVARAALEGDVTALEIWERAGHYIGTAIASLIVILNPEMVIIGGGVANAGRLIFEPMRRAAIIRSSVYMEPGGGVEIVPAVLGEDAGAIGAAVWAIRKYVQQPAV
jgi:glucokinase